MSHAGISLESPRIVAFGFCCGTCAPAVVCVWWRGCHVGIRHLGILGEQGRVQMSSPHVVPDVLPGAILCGLRFLGVLSFY